MKSLVGHMTEGTVDDNALENALTSGNAVMRIQARGAASNWSEGFVRWINDELQRPKADPVDVLQATWTLQVQMLLSVAAQVCDVAGDEKLLRVLTDHVNDKGAVHLSRVRKALDQ